MPTKTRSKDSPRPHPPAAPEPFPVDPLDDSNLLAYYEDLYAWHGYIRFLGLPHLGDDPDVPLDTLFVEPNVSKQLISLDLDPGRWPDHWPARKVIVEHPRLVLLGDPGSGKSTLVNWITWQLTRPGGSPWRRALGDLVPVPLVLRELGIGRSVTWESLLDAFFARPVAKALRGYERWEELLGAGQVFFLLDGVDELGSKGVREALRKAVFEGMDQYPNCRFLLTSRWVGYDEVPFDYHRYFHISSGRRFLEGAWVRDEELGWRKYRVPDSASEEDVPKLVEEVEEAGVIFEDDPALAPQLAYLTPFDDSQIERFVANWYARRELREEERATKDLLEAIRSKPYTHRLARVPNLLTLMALIYRVEADLPDGRARVYRRIEDAYLESIDRKRKLLRSEARRADKRRWLAYVGFRMQQRRERMDEDEGAREVVVDRETVEDWLEEAMASSEPDAREDPSSYLDFLGRRAGLLLPRGEGLYAFTHLSFQEYFAAVYLAEHVTSPEWLLGEPTPEGTAKRDLERYTGDARWRETMVLLFELVANRSGWTEVVAKAVWGEDFERLQGDEDYSQKAAAEILAEIATDPYSGLSKQLRRQAFLTTWRWELRRQQKLAWFDLAVLDDLVIPATLGASEPWREPIWRAFEEAAEAAFPSQLRLNKISDLRPLQSLHLKRLNLAGTEVKDLGPLRSVLQLQELSLLGTPVEDLRPLQELSLLQSLNLSGTRVKDLGPLRELVQLQGLNLSGTEVHDLGPLQELPRLRWLNVDWTRVEDLRALEKLSQLQVLSLLGTPVSDLEPVRHVASVIRYSEEAP